VENRILYQSVETPPTQVLLAPSICAFGEDRHSVIHFATLVPGLLRGFDVVVIGRLDDIGCAPRAIFRGL
jgi:hypothetical protein